MVERSQSTPRVLGWVRLTRSFCPGVGPFYALISTTIDAKRRDFQLFLDYFARMMRSDSIDDWTRSVTLGFVQWLENEGNEGRGYAPTSVNRTMATLRRAARWIQDRRPFLAGDPFERVSDLVVTIPPAKGLSRKFCSTAM